jgi:hypothetical protein
MKSCPACNRTYSDRTLTFCLEDGSILSPFFMPAASRAVKLRAENHSGKHHFRLQISAAHRKLFTNSLQSVKKEANKYNPMLPALPFHAVHRRILFVNYQTSGKFNIRSSNK